MDRLLDFCMGIFVGIVAGVALAGIFMQRPVEIVSYMNDEVIQCNMKVSGLRHELAQFKKCELFP